MSKTKKLLRELYEYGLQYIARDQGGELHAYEFKPTRYEQMWGVASEQELWGQVINVTWVDWNFNLDWEDEPLDIAKVLGIVDWKSVKVDTPVLVRHSENEEWKCRHFCGYRESDDKPYYCYAEGRTNYTAAGVDPLHTVTGWEFCRLAEE